MDTGQETIILATIVRRGMLFLLSFSDGFEIRATKGVIDRLGLAEGAEFTPDTFKELKTILEQKFAYYSAESLLARRPYSVGEFKQRLRRKEISEKLIAEIVKEFRSKKILDDFGYAVTRAQSLIDRKPAGKGYLVAWLQKRLVPREIAEKAVAELLSDVDEVETAIELLQRRRGAFEKFDIETARRKAYTYLSRRAISYGASRAAFEKVFGKSTD
jgi:SOS response regulatory protein OraA/RecX